MLSIVAKITVKAGSEADFEAVAKKLVAAVNANEAGCEFYQLHKGDDPLVYTFIERYRDEDATVAHRKSDHFRQYGKEMGAFMDGPPDVLRLTQV